MKSPRRLVSFLLFAVFSGFPSAHAQVTTATFYGIVNDSSGALVPGAVATLTNQGTSATLTRTSDSNGEFAFDFLPVGSYVLRIEARGFKKLESKPIDLASAQVIRQTFNLEVGALSETVTVEGSAPLVS